MIDREKVIKALECCANSEAHCSVEECPYFDIYDWCWEKLEQDALELLKKQEPRRGRWVLEEETALDYSEPIYLCSVCNDYEAWGKTECTKYCPNCGAKKEGGETDAV